MISSTTAYQEAIVADARRILVRAIIDIIDPDMTYGNVVSSGESKYSKPSEIHDKKFDAPHKYATLETNRWVLDGQWDVFPDNPKDVTERVGFLGSAMSDETGAFSPGQWCELQFSNVSILQAFSVYFSKNEDDGIPEDFTVEVKQGGTAYFTKAFEGNKETMVALSGFSVYDPDAIRITVTKWSLPYRRMRITEILPGIYEEWDGSILASFDVKHQGDVSNTSLPYGTCTLRMDNLDRRFEPRSKEGIFQSITDRQSIDVAVGVRTTDGDEYKRVGMFYQYSGGWKTGDNGLTMQWDLVDIIGLLSGREYVPPDVLPTTLGGWMQSLVSQLGTNFSKRYIVDENYVNVPVTARSLEDVVGSKCGDILSWACMASGTWARADAETGYLAAEPLWDQGNKLTLANMETYPVMKANPDIAAIVFKLNDGNDTQYVVSGNSTASSGTVSVNNPFIHTQAEALTAAKNILATYGGNQYEITGRGDMSSEIGDVDTVWLNESVATTARRIYQTFNFTNGVLQGCKSTLLQADGSFLYQTRVVITESGSWTAPAGVSKLRYILVGKGSDGMDGKDGSWSSAGENGADGIGGKVVSGTMNINPQQTFQITIAENTVFGAYSSANGEVYPYGYTDIASGDSFGRTGVKEPVPGSGDGGSGGKGGRKGNRHSVHKVDEWGWGYDVSVVDNYPGDGEEGVKGVLGCVVLYYDKN